MEFHHLASFVTVARTGNLTRAAEALNTTPPSVSGHIRQLEEELGLRLFVRNARGMRLTAQGELLLEKALSILSASDEFRSLAGALGRDIRGRVTIGINAGPAYLRVPDIIQTLYQEHPNLHIEVKTLSTPEILKQVEQGNLDCGFVFGPHDGRRVKSIFLSRVDLEIAVPKAFHDQLNGPDPSCLASLPWIFPSRPCPFLETVLADFRAKGIDLFHRVVADDDITKLTFIDQGAAVSVLERGEAEAFRDKGKVVLFRGKKRFGTRLFFAFALSKAEDLCLRAVVSGVRKAWENP